MKPVIFLDFDGVLNNTPWLTSPRKRALDMADTPETQQERERRDFDPANVARLNALLAAAPDAVVVVSSSWRYGVTVGYLGELLGAVGVKDAAARVVDMTPTARLHEDSGLYHAEGRGSEILRWLSSPAGSEITGYVILDDDNDMDGVRGHFVRTDRNLGLTDADVTYALRVLARPVTPAAPEAAR